MELKRTPGTYALGLYYACKNSLIQIPEDNWRLKDPDFLKEADETGIRKFVEWIIEKVS